VLRTRAEAVVPGRYHYSAVAIRPDTRVRSMNFARNSFTVKMWHYSRSKILIPSLKDG